MFNKISLMIFLCFSVSCYAEQDNTSAVANYFSTIKNNRTALHHFLSAMPKGADLHIHLAGASLAENLMRYGKQDHLCIDPTSFKAIVNLACAADYKLDAIKIDSPIFNDVVDAWSMKDFHEGKETGHDHFFSTFGKYGYISGHHTAEILTEVAERAGEENESYLELMTTPDRNESGKLGGKIGWNDDWLALRVTLLQQGLKDIVKTISTRIQTDEAYKNKQLQCGTSQAKAGCQVQIRYLYQVLREQPKEQIFAQLLAGFEAANNDKRIVGINMVQAEDGPISMRDYTLQMQLVAFFHTLYPQVAISLHAGELVRGLVGNEGLRFHIRQAVEIAHAQRIGHGVDIVNEDNYEQLLQEMSQNKIMVEINLTSNEDILKVMGKDHPLPLYLIHKVPVSLTTDDEGVERTNLTDQYDIAASRYNFTYNVLKTMARNSLFYSFVPGKNLWQDDDYKMVIAICSKDNLGDTQPSSSCQQFLNANEKAKLQWDLEHRFTVFEKAFRVMSS